MRMQRAFTMIELAISMALLFMVLPSIFYVAERFYRHQRYVTEISGLRQSARECAARVGRDISVNRGFSIRPDNHGLTIMSSSGSTTYSLNDNALLRKDGRGAVKLTEAMVRDIIFVQYNSRVVMTITFDFYNINTRHREACTFIETVRR